MSNRLTHGSLFSGLEAFGVAAREAGIETKWVCEIEPYCRLVLKTRFPDVKQYGDIRKLRGAEVEPVDIITFGSPCQSFSQAGRREGLEGESGLFYEAVRVIQEMREATNNQYPRYAIAENVVGIYSSKSQGKSDFREVMNELLKIADKTVDVPVPEGGKFHTAGAVVGDGYSLAWRTLCASKFGVAQRRRRMFLVVSFGDECAGEVLSEQEGERRDFTPCYSKREGTAGGIEAGVGNVSYFEPGALQRIDKGVSGDCARTIRAHMGDNQAAVAYTHKAVENHPGDSRLKVCEDGVFPAVTAKFGTGGNNCHYVLAERKPCASVTQEYVGSLCSSDYKGTACIFEPKTMKLREGKGGGGKGPLIQNDKSAALSCNNEQTLFEPHTYNICSDASNAMRSENPRSGIYEAATMRTIDTGGGSPSRNQGGTVIALQGSLINRRNESGPCGIGYREDAAYTVNTVDGGGAICYRETVGAVCSSDYKGIRNQDIENGKAVVETFGNNGYGKWNEEPASLKASGGDCPGGENVAVENRYAVRRLTPTECLKLQGLPSWWLDEIHISEPAADDIAYWREAWAELGKKKTDNQLRKWLGNPYSDSAAYRAINRQLTRRTVCLVCVPWNY